MMENELVHSCGYHAPGPRTYTFHSSICTGYRIIRRRRNRSPEQRREDELARLIRSQARDMKSQRCEQTINGRPVYSLDAPRGCTGQNLYDLWGLFNA